MLDQVRKTLLNVVGVREKEAGEAHKAVKTCICCVQVKRLKKDMGKLTEKIKM